VGYQDQVYKNSRYSFQLVGSCFYSLRVLIFNKISRVPVSQNDFTYLFTPRSTIRPLFDYFDLPFPQVFEQPLNFSEVLQLNDTLPSGLDTAGISMGGETFRSINHWSLIIFLAFFSNNGVAHSMKSTPLAGMGMFAAIFFYPNSYHLHALRPRWQTLYYNGKHSRQTQYFLRPTWHLCCQWLGLSA